MQGGVATSSAKRVLETADPLAANMAALSLGNTEPKQTVPGPVEPGTSAQDQGHGEPMLAATATPELAVPAPAEATPQQPPAVPAVEPENPPPAPVEATPEQPAPVAVVPVVDGQPLQPPPAVPAVELGQPMQPAELAQPLQPPAVPAPLEPPQTVQPAEPAAPVVVMTPAVAQSAASRLQATDGLPPSPTRSHRKPQAVKQHVFHEEPSAAGPALEARQPPSIAPPQAVQALGPGQGTTPAATPAATLVSPGPQVAAPVPPIVQPAQPAPPAVKASPPLPATVAAPVAPMSDQDRVNAVLGQLGMSGAGASGSADGALQLPEDLRALILQSQGTPQQAETTPDASGANQLDPSVSTATHRPSAMRLARFMESPEGAKFPHMQKMFNGTRDDP